MPRGDLRDRIDDPAADAATAGTDRHDDRRLLARGDDDVRRASRAVDEVPGDEPALLLLDDQRALAGDDEEAFLRVLAVVHAEGLARLENVDVDPELWETPLALEVAVEAERALVAPARLARVDHEPAFDVDDEAVLAHPG